MAAACCACSLDVRHGSVGAPGSPALANTALQGLPARDHSATVVIFTALHREKWSDLLIEMAAGWELCWDLPSAAALDAETAGHRLPRASLERSGAAEHCPDGFREGPGADPLTAIVCLLVGASRSVDPACGLRPPREIETLVSAARVEKAKWHRKTIRQALNLWV